MMTFPELLSNSEQTSENLTCRLRMALDFWLLTPLKEDRRTSEDTAALSVAWFQYYTSVHVCQSAICILHRAIYCTGAHVSSPYNALSAPLMTTPTMVQVHLWQDWNKHWFCCYRWCMCGPYQNGHARAHLRALTLIGNYIPKYGGYNCIHEHGLTVAALYKY